MESSTQDIMKKYENEISILNEQVRRIKSKKKSKILKFQLKNYIISAKQTENRLH